VDAVPDAPRDLLVIQPLRDFVCVSCAGTDDFLTMEDRGPLCLTCTDLDHLEFLPAGDVALTRRARKLSTLSAVVVRFSKTRKRYERRGVLVEPAALAQAEEQCLADQDLRLRRQERDRERRAAEDGQFVDELAAEIQRLFPGCPAVRVRSIAGHAAVRGSGRVGRTAAGRALDEGAVTAAVIASVRHEDTEYDSLLMSGTDRQTARDRVRAAIDGVVDQWRST
jgi:hypothetical protein